MLFAEEGIITRYTSARQYVMACDSGRRSRVCRLTVKQRFLDVSSGLGKFFEKCRWTVTRQWLEVTRPSADCQTTFLGRLKRFVKYFEKSRWTVTRQWLEVTRPSADCQTTFFGRFKRFGDNFVKIRWTLTRQWSRSRDSGRGHATVGRLSNNVFWTFQAIWEIFLKKVAERSRDSGWRSRDRRPTVKQRFLDVSSDLGIFWKNSLNGHATVVGGHAFVGGLSNNVFWTFQAIWENFEKSRWTVTRQWLEVTRPLADCETTFFGRFKRFGEIFKKVAERSRDSGWGHATVGWLSNNVFWTFQAVWENFVKCRWTVTRQWLRSRDRQPTVKQRFLDVSSDFGKFWKKSLNGHATVVEVTRPSADCQTTFFGRFKRFGTILKKVAEQSRDSGRGHATVGRLSNNVFWTFQAIWEIFWKKSLNGHATVVEVTRPSADCQTTFFGRFKRFGKYFEKSRWTVTRQWSEVTRPSADCQTTFLDVSSN